MDEAGNREILTTSAAVIDRLGGNTEVAKITGARAKTVSMWRTVERGFPPETYAVLSAALAARNLQAPLSLWKQIEPASS